MNRYVVGMVTCASRAEARQLARAVLTAKLAACVNVLGGVESHYWWQGKLAAAKECLLLIKTTRPQTAAVTRLIKARHSYEVPEVIFLPVATGDRQYLNWIRSALAALALVLWTGPVVRADPIDQLVVQLGSTNEEARADAAEQLARIGGPRAEKQFRDRLASANPEQRQMAVIGLLQVSGADEDLERVRARLQDDNSTVRWSAVLALGQSGRVEAVPWLQELAKTEENESVQEAVRAAIVKLQAGIAWGRSLPAARQQARDLKKPVLAYFYVRGSDYCQRLEEGVLADKDVVNAAQEFVCVRVDAGQQTETAQKLDVRGAPTILVLDGQGNEMSRTTGLVDKTKLLARLAETRRGKLTFLQARRQALKDPADVPANWKVAETYLEEGREDLAEPHLRNVISADEPNRYGYTDDALFALGFILGKRGQYAQAVFGLERLLERWPGFKDKDKALYCLGLSRLALGQRDRGRAALEQLIREFPESSAVQSAKHALEKLESK